MHPHSLEQPVSILLKTLTGGCCHHVCQEAVSRIGVGINKVGGIAGVFTAKIVQQLGIIVSPGLKGKGTVQEVAGYA